MIRRWRVRRRTGTRGSRPHRWSADGRGRAHRRHGAQVRGTVAPEAVHALLRHLEAKGFEVRPERSDSTTGGERILTYIEGTAGGEVDWPPELRTDAGLAAVVQLLAANSTVPPPTSSRRRDPTWLGGAPSLAPGQIICHNDAGPWNLIWRDGQPVALIDWDFAGPSNPLDDVSYVAFYAIPMRDDDHCRRCGFTGARPRASPARRVRDIRDGATPADSSNVPSTIC